MLLRFVRDGSLSPDSFGSTNAPEVVIRQVQQSNMEVWDLKQGRVMVYKGISPLLLSCFDPKKSFYLYEPGDSLKGPQYVGLKIPTMCSVSPDERRYKEFEKNGAVKVYMPTWTLDELQAVRDYIHNRSPDAMPLNNSAIAERFNAVGGIFRHVFAPNFNAVLKKQEEAIKQLDPKKFSLNKLDRQLKEVSHHVAQYRVTTEGDDAFLDANIDIVSEAVRNATVARFRELKLDEKIDTLISNDHRPKYMSAMCPLYYEDVVAGQLYETGGIEWERRNRTDAEFSRFNMSVTAMKEGKPPVFANMVPGVLYRSTKSNFPAVDMMLRTEDGLLYGLQVTRQEQNRTIETDAVDNWLKSVEMDNSMEKVRIAVIPKPALADNFKAKYDRNVSGYPLLEVWKLPSDYGQRF